VTVDPDGLTGGWLWSDGTDLSPLDYSNLAGVALTDTPGALDCAGIDSGNVTVAFIFFKIPVFYLKRHIHICCGKCVFYLYY